MISPFVSVSALREYIIANGCDPGGTLLEGSVWEESDLCELCQQAIGNEPYVVLEPPPGIIVRRKFHGPCLIQHLKANMENPQDEISAYINRKIVSS